MCVDPAKIELQAQVIELRSIGWSFPAIAKHVKISVGSVWNIMNRKTEFYVLKDCENILCRSRFIIKHRVNSI